MPSSFRGARFLLMPVAPELLDLIRCPKCHGRLSLRSAATGGEGLECAACRVVYPVVDEIPQLLVEEARALGA